MNSKKIYLMLLLVICIPSGNLLSSFNENYNKGVNHYLDGKLEKSEEALRNAYVEAPDNKKVKSLLAEVLLLRAGKMYKEKKYEKALSYLNSASEIDPKNKKINEVKSMLYDKLNPESAEMPSVEKVEDAFSDLKKIRDSAEKKRVSRTKIIKSPPPVISKKEKELLRPIMIDSSNEMNMTLIIVISIGAFVFLTMIIFIGVWMKEVLKTNRENLEKLSRESRAQTEKLENEIKRLKKRGNEKTFKRTSSLEKNRKTNLRKQEEKLKKEYEKLLKESMRSDRKGPRFVPEPEISIKANKEDREKKEIKESFNKLKNKDYYKAVSLLNTMSSDISPWKRLYSAELAIELEPYDSLEILKLLVKDKEYQVKKMALKILREIKEEKELSSTEQLMAKEILKSSVGEGWVV